MIGMKPTCLKDTQRTRKMSLRGVSHRRATPTTAHLSVLLKRMGLLRLRLAMTELGAFSGEKCCKTKKSMILRHKMGNSDRKSTKNMPKKQALEHAEPMVVNKTETIGLEKG